MSEIACACEPKISYIDLHCDTLTVCSDRGERLGDCRLQINAEKLKRSRCAAQCFAVFTQGEGAAEAAARYFAGYPAQIAQSGLRPLLCGRDLEQCVRSGQTGALLTVENLGFIGEDYGKIEECYRAGVRMASLVWNHENALAYPNMKFRGGQPLLSEREERGLKEAGRRAVEKLDELGVIFDISHLSDGGAREALRGRKIPAVASHSNAAAVCPVCRNLTDELIRLLADCGGVAGVNFCAEFVGNRDIFAGLLAHICHIVKVGGEDTVALGSDFDGIAAPEGLEDCTRVPLLFDCLSKAGFSARMIEKFARGNFMRVFSEVCGT